MFMSLHFAKVLNKIGYKINLDAASTSYLPDGNACDTDTDFLTLPEIKTLINSFVSIGTSKISIVGGEPSL
jgi:hypothetical protein